MSGETCSDFDFTNDTVALTQCNNTFYLDECLDACQKLECTSTGKSSTKDIVFTVLIQILVFLLVFGLAGSVDFGHFKARFRSKGVYIGLLCQFLLMPLIGFAVVAIFSSLPPLFAVALLIVCASPGGSYSNWWCNLINADLALSVAMTTVSTIISAGVLPLNIYIYVEVAYQKLRPAAYDSIKIPYVVIGYTLANVIAAVCLGLLFGVKCPKYMKVVNKVGTVAGFLSIILGLVATTESCADPFGQKIEVYFIVAIPVLLGLVAATFFSSLANLPKPQRVAVSIETAYQNTGIALAVSLSLGPKGRAAAIVPIIYGGYEALFFGLYALGSWYIGWTLSPDDEPLWTILFNDYQDLIDGHKHYGGVPKDSGKISADSAGATDKSDFSQEAPAPFTGVEP
mmetsp:Transcript_6706/g.10471  ORF Transcript_6706/g.10471 Transcript_6706/m.10471 type:complete len:399 (-) Transcript_6706:166-1362(-)